MSTSIIEIGIDSFAAMFSGDVANAISDTDALAQLIERIELADQAGLDIFGIGEHHRKGFLDSAPALILSAAAARTKRIRLTSAVTVLSAADPVRVFQEFATLDLISNVQRWRIENEGNGYYRITSGHSGKSINIAGSSLTNGAPISQWTYGGGTNQQFAFGFINSTTMATNTEEMSLAVTPEVAENGFSVFPNPVDNKTTVNVPPSMVNGKITISNAAGVVVYSETATQSAHIINMSGMAPGIYVVNIKLGNESLSTKVIKN